MKTLFQYNWQVRDDWFSWCETVPEGDLLKSRGAGVGGILKTLFHIVAVEYSWICDITGRPDLDDDFEAHASLERVVSLSRTLHPVVSDFVLNWTDSRHQEKVTVYHPRTGQQETFREGEILDHIIAHEIHHIGQLSVWARELGREPVTANLIRRGIYN